MIDQEINVAIAEACGWHRDAGVWFNGEVGYDSTPDYCHDLNAMHEAENSLNSDQYVCFLARLSTLADVKFSERSRSIISATARHRAEAFLRTIGKWRD